MNILITGGSGLIGKALTHSLQEDGHSIWVLTRKNPATFASANCPTLVHWDGMTTNGWGELVSQMDAVFNLAGESLASWPWTKAQKQRFWDSRVNTGQAITEAFRAASPRPKTLLQASGINHYGLHGSPADETTPPGDDFLSRLTVAWEEATKEVEQMGVRRCVTRQAVVLASKGGLFPLMSLPVRLFVGGRLGNGKQSVCWVHLDDVVGAMRYLLENEQASGAYNLISPETVSNSDFYRILAKVLHRPYWFQTPAILLKVILGEMSVLVLEGRPAIPRRLLESGYRFQYDEILGAISQIEL